MGSCTSPGGEEKTGPRTVVSTSEFADLTVVRTPPESPVYPHAAPMHTDPTPTTGLVAIAGDPPKPGRAATTPSNPSNPADAVVVDEMVGQINGEPIYAEEFFRDMDARLRMESTQKSLKQWIKDVREAVERKMLDRLRDELYLAEFRSTMTPEMKVGVQYFLQNLRQNLESVAGGSSEQANQTILEAEGITLNEKVKDTAQQQFVREQMRKAIANRVYITSRDIETYYDQNYEKFHPPAIAIFAVIRVPLTDSGRIKRVESRIASGDEFAAIAAAESEFNREPKNPEQKNQHRVVLQSDTFEEEEFWAIPELNTATKQLTVGATSSRIEVRGSAWWISLLAIERPPGRSLYDVQLEIEQILRNERWRNEEMRYLSRLMAKSNISDMETMIYRLVDYAAVRYYVKPADATEK